MNLGSDRALADRTAGHQKREVYRKAVRQRKGGVQVE